MFTVQVYNLKKFLKLKIKIFITFLNCINNFTQKKKMYILHLFLIL